MISPLHREETNSRPLLAIQFGEGNFLRGYIDWMLQQLVEHDYFPGQIMMIKPRAHGHFDQINAQKGLYTVVERGIVNGKPVNKHQLITVVRGCLNPYEEWPQTVAAFCTPSVRFIFSNTTEAGIEYKKEPFHPDACPHTFPAKLTALLHARFCALGGAPEKGLIIIPCELIPQNADRLREHILHYAQDWELPSEFSDWVTCHCAFINTLVDRIVSGYPQGEEQEWEKTLGYSDKLITCVEPYHLLVAETDESSLEKELPLKSCGINIVYTDDLTSWRLRKVRLLNATHTATVPAACMAGLIDVKEMMQDEDFQSFVHQTLFKELVPSLPGSEEDNRAYAESVIERFRNPFTSHKLQAITLNCIVKWRERVLPALKDYRQKFGELPQNLSTSLAALIYLYLERPVADTEETREFFLKEKEQYGCSQDIHHLVQRILANDSFWNENLNEIHGLSQLVERQLTSLMNEGSRSLIKSLFQNL